MSETRHEGVRFTGARWIRAALQVNPYSYKGNGSPLRKFASEDVYNQELLARCEAEGIELIAVTDHWAVDSAGALIRDAAGTALKVLPGFEANTSEGIHLLVIFEADTALALVNAAIGACGVDPGCENGTPGASYAEIMRQMTKRGALVIPAHANVVGSGLLGRQSGVPLEKMIKNTSLHAIAISPGVIEAKDQTAVLTGRKPYKRTHLVATIHADDVCHPDRLGAYGATTWFKVSEPCLAGIKHAVRIPQTRVSLIDPVVTNRVLFREISWVGGFLDGVRITFAGDLTALIGGRGTGKSTVIESVRYVLGMVPIGEGATRDHDAMVSRVLGSGTVVRLVVDAISPRQGEFVIQRTVGDPAVVIDSSGTRTSLRPWDVVGEIEIFGQHELAEVAQEKPLVARMIERIAGFREEPPELSEARRKLRENRTLLSSAEDGLERLENDLNEMPRLEEAVSHFNASGWVAQLGEKQRLDRDQAILKEVEDRLDLVAEAVEHLRQADLATSLTAKIEGVEDSPRASHLQDAIAALGGVAVVVVRVTTDFELALADANSQIAKTRGDWAKETESLVEEYAAVVRKLRDAGHEPERYLTSTNALDALKLKVPNRDTAKGKVAALVAERVKLLGELDAVEIAVKRRLADAVRRANRATKGAVLVKPVPSPDRSDMVALINRSVRGQRKQLIEVAAEDGFSPRAFVAAVRAGSIELDSQFAIRGAQAQAIMAAGEPFLRELEEISVGQAVDVSLDTGTDGTREYRSLDDLSKGQKATALLLLLLTAAETPLIVDQPEDDLDNRFVYDQVVARLRELKGARQVIVCTHNANVPVLGDAELIVTLEGDGMHGRPSQSGTGSLDSPGVRDAVEQLLEGGRAAFEARRYLYGV